MSPFLMCSSCFCPASAVGESPQVCSGPLSVHSAIQQEEVCLGTAGRSPRYVQCMCTYSANFSPTSSYIIVHVHVCVFYCANFSLRTCTCTCSTLRSIHDACS